MDNATTESSAPSPAPSPARRRSLRQRATRETEIAVRIELDTSRPPQCETGLPFFDHMLSQLGKHSGVSLSVMAKGDLHVDAHHTVEDTGIVLGEALAEALGDKSGIRRFASVAIPLDEALVDVAVDLAGRAFLHYEVPLAPDTPALGMPGFDPQLAEEFWRAFANSSGTTLHISLRYGRNTHHILEASFKGVGRALRDAVRVEGSEIPSTKGSL